MHSWKKWTSQPVSLEITSEEDHQIGFLTTQAARENWQEGQEGDMEELSNAVEPEAKLVWEHFHLDSTQLYHAHRALLKLSGVKS